ncbi:hypothetical protein HK102_005776, partial [Quaeritorhiza haematococci]
MRGSVQVANHFCQRKKAFYVQYEDRVWRVPRDVVETELGDKLKDDHTVTWVSSAAVRGHPIAFFADEIQHLYVPSESQQQATGLEILFQLLKIGKNPHTFGVLSGSSRDTATLPFKRDGMAQRFSMHPDLNRT